MDACDEEKLPAFKESSSCLKCGLLDRHFMRYCPGCASVGAEGETAVATESMQRICSQCGNTWYEALPVIESSYTSYSAARANLIKTREQDDEFAAKIKQWASEEMKEPRNHELADGCLVELLVRLGYTKTVEAWQAVHKWYD